MRDRRGRVPLSLFCSALTLGLVAAVASPALATAPKAPPGRADPGAPSATDYRSTAPQADLVAAADVAARRDGHARVVVSLRTKVEPLAGLSPSRASAQQSTIRNLQDRAIAAVPHAKVLRRFTIAPMLALEATAGEIAALAKNPTVADVQLDRLVAPDLASSTAIVGSARLNSRGVTGAGQTVAIIDTGVSSSHPFLVGRVVDEACFGGCLSGAGSASGPGTGVNCPTFIAGCGHGTHVAGIAAGAQGPNPLGFNGVAPGATIMAINVFHRVDNFWPFNFCGSDPSPCARAWASDEVAGLEYVYSHRFAHSIAAVNMSIGDGGNNTSPCTGSGMKPVIDNLAAAGIATVVAAGNDGHTAGLSEPACVGSAVSVGATTDGDVVPSWSNSANYLDLLAPGVDVVSSIPGGGFASMSGTSMATPHVTGAFALMKQKYPSAGVAEILRRLQETGTPVFDPKSGFTNRRINIDKAAQFATFNSDFSRDLHADIGVYRPSTGTWFVPGQPAAGYGVPGDKPVPGDYNGDGVADRAVYRPSTGIWYIQGVGAFGWGIVGDIPVPADYNGDGTTDIAVWRPSTGVWYVRGQFTVGWGLGSLGDIAVPADYNGDGTADIAVWRASTGVWWVRGQFTATWGLGALGDVPVPADYNGDGTADVAVWRPATGVWWVRGQFTQQWGTPGDIPTPRDVTGDGVAELVVWRPGSGTWFTLWRVPFIGPITWSTNWGIAGDWPIGPTSKQLA